MVTLQSILQSSLVDYSALVATGTRNCKLLGGKCRHAIDIHAVIETKENGLGRFFFMCIPKKTQDNKETFFVELLFFVIS